MNFLAETLNRISECGLDANNIAYIGSRCGKYRCTWEAFQKMADRGYARSSIVANTQVARDLIIAFSSGDQLRRALSVDGDYWEHVPSTPVTEICVSITRLISDTPRDFVRDHRPLPYVTLAKLHENVE